MIAMAPLYGGFASGPTASNVLQPNRVSVLLMVMTLNALMTYYTYFKDYRGDLLAGKRTLVVLLGPGRSRIMAFTFAFIPTLLFGLLRLSGFHQTPLNRTFLILGLLTVFLQLWTGVLYWKNTSGASAYASLQTNFRAAACGQATLIAIFDPDLAIWLFIFSYIFVGFLFDLHQNHKQ
jgi:geranylgeranylglycerol-phosphate geranylgeranyltransferase